MLTYDGDCPYAIHRHAPKIKIATKLSSVDAVAYVLEDIE